MKKLGFLIISIILLTTSCQTEQENLPPAQTAGSDDYLQISLAVKNLDQSLKFYAGLGFMVITADRSAEVPWAVISDGTNIFMLSQNEFPSPSLTYYLADFDEQMKVLQDFQLISDGSRGPKSAISMDPNGLGITLINLKSQDLPRKPAGFSIIAGSFTEISIPTQDIEASKNFWSRIGFKLQTGFNNTPDKNQLSDNLVTIGFYTGAIFPSPTLTYRNSDLTAVLEKLQSIAVKILPIRSETSEDILELIFASPDGQLLRIIPE